MMDLQSDRSLIRNLLGQGLDIYIIDWGYPDHGDRYVTMEDYIDVYLDDCVEYVRERPGCDQINLLGVCQGGTFAVIYSALYPEKIRNLMTMVAPVDFHTTDGLLNVWSQDMDIDNMVDTMGIIPGEFMNVGFLMLKPFQLMVDKYVGLMDNLDDPATVRQLRAHGEVDLRQPRPGRRGLPQVPQGSVPGEQAGKGGADDRRQKGRP